MSLPLLLAALTQAQAPPLTDTSSAATVVERIPGGRHARFVTWHGPVHVFLPDGYRRETAAIVVYLHGYFTDVDGAIRDHHLLEKFARAKKNALYIVPEAPTKKGEPLFWPSLPALIAEVERRVNLRRPDGILAVIGHSAAYRTIHEWMRFPRLNLVILVDGFYDYEDEMLAWITTGAGAEAHRLIVVSNLTLARAERVEEKVPFPRRRPELPPSARSFTNGERSVRYLHLVSQYDHMGLVTSDEVIPMLVDLIPTPRL
ncbi:MAG: hypothetical protein U1E65_05185 [Myxococcota bacterium]